MAELRTAYPEWLRLTSITVLGIASYGAYLGLPIILGSLAKSGVLTEADLGWLASLELLAMMAGSIFAARMVAWPTNRVVLPGLALAVVANLLCGFATTEFWLFVLRALAGFGSGICFAIAIARLAAFGDPTKNSGWFTAGVTLGGSLYLVLLPIADSHFGLAGVFGVLGACLVVAALFAPFFPQALPEAEAEAASPAAHAGGAWLGWLLMLSVLVYNAGATSFWAYAERLGDWAHVPLEQTSAALSVANLVSAGVCVGSLWIGRRWGLIKPQIICLLISAVVFATWTAHEGVIGYWARTLLYYEALTVANVLQLSLIAAVDRSGRLGALVPAAQGLGQALGPAGGAFFLTFGMGYQPKLIGEGVSMALTAVIVFAVFLLIKRAGETEAVKPQDASPRDAGDAVSP